MSVTEVNGEDFSEGSGLSPEVEEVEEEGQAEVAQVDFEDVGLGEELVGDEEVTGEAPCRPTR